MPPGGPWAPGGPQGSTDGFPPPERKRGRTWLAAGLAAVLVVAVGGGAWAFNALRSKGPQPEQALPADTVAYVRVDLDPAADQKLAALQFLKKFPEAEKKLGDEDEDLRKSLWEAIASDDSDLKDVDYATDIEPWLGNRAGLAAVPVDGEKESEPVAVIQVTDQKKAEAALEKLRSEDNETGFAFTDDYLVVAESQETADQVVKASADQPLAENEEFRADMGALDSTGVLSFWADAAKLADLVGPRAVGHMSGGPQFDGRVVGALSFDSSYAQLETVLRGGEFPEVKETGIKLGELPESTAVAVSVAGAGPSFEQNWPTVESALRAAAGGQFDSIVAAAKQQFGLQLPDDLVTLLGKDVTLALDERGLADAVQGGGSLPQVGLRSTTDVAKAEDVLAKIKNMLSASGLPIELGTASGSDSVALATSESYAKELVSGGSLAQTDTFRTALTNTEKAQFGLFVDIDKLEQVLPPSMPNRATFEAFKAVGMSGSFTADGAAFTVRVLVD